MNLYRNISLFIIALLIAACGGKSGEQQTETAESTSPADDIRTIEIVGIDAMKFAVTENSEGITVSDTVGREGDLLRLETIEAEPGEQIRIRMITRSQLPATAMAHNWVLMSLDANVQEFVNAAIQAKANDYIPQNMTDQILAQTGLAARGQTEEVTFTVPEEPGEYEYICSFPGHYAAGMKGMLVVKEPAM